MIRFGFKVSNKELGSISSMKEKDMIHYIFPHLYDTITKKEKMIIKRDYDIVITKAYYESQMIYTKYNVINMTVHGAEIISEDNVLLFLLQTGGDDNDR